jgi:anoctamin-10
VFFSEQYEDSLIVKNFIFLFVNSYASFYYLAFVADFYDDCPPAGCMYSLAINLAVVFGSSLASSCCMQLVLPYLKYKYQYYFGAAEAGRKRTRPEKEYLLATVSLVHVAFLCACRHVWWTRIQCLRTAEMRHLQC